MPEICYVDKDFGDEALGVIGRARAVCKAYADQGYDLTLRQLYYQFVAHDYFPDSRRWHWIEATKKWRKAEPSDETATKNADPNYKWLGSIINDARLAGYLDWDYIVDRTRNLRSLAHWDNAAQLVNDAAEQFRHDRWKDQKVRIEVWIEKDALVGVLQQACPELDIPYFSCRGYTSQSELWGAAQRLGKYIGDGQDVVVVHLGDHDPSGIDMTRDIEERLAMFIAQDLEVEDSNCEPWEYVEGLDQWGASLDRKPLTIERIALNMDQVKQYNPPPNPAKITDSRAGGYIQRFGRSSWELDALEPTVLVQLIQDAVFTHRDVDAWDASTKAEEGERVVLTEASNRWSEVEELFADAL